jgi:hypothetical protein
MIIIQLSIIVCLILLIHNLSIAQNDLGSFDIWNSNSVYAGQGYFAYSFTIDTQGFGGGNSVRDLVIHTDFG